MWRRGFDHRGHDHRPGQSLSDRMIRSLITRHRQDVFVIPEGGPGALAELERRKFTAEEGASLSAFIISIMPTHHEHRII